MRLPALLRRHSTPAEIGGVVRLDRRTKNLTKRLGAGEIAVIHHSDLDRVSAEALVLTGVSAVINAVPSVSGRYPNLGPGILLEAGIVLIDDTAIGADCFLRSRWLLHAKTLRFCRLDFSDTISSSWPLSVS